MLFSDTIDKVQRKHPKDVFCISLIVVPLSRKSKCTATEFPQGKEVEVWVDADTLQDAEQKARYELMVMDWYPARFICWEMMPARQSWIPDWLAYTRLLQILGLVCFLVACEPGPAPAPQPPMPSCWVAVWLVSL